MYQNGTLQKSKGTWSFPPPTEIKKSTIIKGSIKSNMQKGDLASLSCKTVLKLPDGPTHYYLAEQQEEGGRRER